MPARVTHLPSTPIEGNVSEYLKYMYGDFANGQDDEQEEERDTIEELREEFRQQVIEHQREMGLLLVRELGDAASKMEMVGMESGRAVETLYNALDRMKDAITPEYFEQANAIIDMYIERNVYV